MMNKKRLAVLAMSAVMAASTVSVPVGAADFSDGAAGQEVAVQSVDVTEVTPDAVGVEGTTPVAGSDDWEVESGIPTGKFTYTCTDGKTYTGDATSGKVTVAPTCENEGYSYYSIEIDGVSFRSPQFDVKEANGHRWGDEYQVTIKAPTCTETGTAQMKHKCSVCGKEENVGAEITLDKKDHSYETVSVTYEAGRNTEVVDGKVQLVDPTKNGKYIEITTSKCSVCNIENVVRKEKTLKAESVVEDYSAVTKISDNIADSNNLLNKRLDADDFPANDDIVLKDCSKPASYEVSVYDTKGRVIDTYTVEVKAHHVMGEISIEYANEADKALCTEIKNDDGSITVVNNSCEKDVTYYEVKKCVAEGCKHEEKTEKTAAKSDKHTIDTTIYNDVKALNARVPYDQLVNTIGGEDNKYVKIVSETATCETAGTVAVEFYCKACGEKADTITGVKVTKLGHDEAIKSANKVEATCQTEGSYDSVTYCERCGKEISRKNIIVKRLAHTNEVGVNADGTTQGNKDTIEGSDASIQFVGSLVFGADENGNADKKIQPGAEFTNEIGYDYNEGGNLVTDGTVSAKVITNCAVCHNNEYVLDTDVKIVVKAVKNETTNVITGKVTAPGSITLVTTYTEDDQTLTKEITLPYFSKAMDTTLAYTGLHKDVDGIYRYYVDGDFAEDYSGIIDFNGNQYVVANGVLCQDASGLNLIDDEWYYLTEGRIRTDVTQVVMYDGEWFYVSEGKLDTSVNDLVSYDGETFVFVDGRYAQEGNGLWIGEEGVWYFLSNGRVAKEYTGLAMYDNEWFYVVNGKLAVDYNGTVEYNGGTFKVVGGMVKEQVK